MSTREEHVHSWWRRPYADVDQPKISHDASQSADWVWRFWDVVRRFDRRYSLGVDTVIAVALFLLFSSSVLIGGPPRYKLLFTAGLTLPLIFRRRAPFSVFAVMSGVAFVQWNVTRPLVADAALLVALYTVVAVADRLLTAVAVTTIEMGVVLATIRWAPVGGHLKSIVFLTGMMSAALFAGVVVRALRNQMDWLAERASRLEYERDQQAFIAAAAERSRIAREMHDVVSHNIQVMVTLADGAAVAQRANPDRAAEAMLEVSGTGRQALIDMRRMLGLLRYQEAGSTPPVSPVSGAAALAPQPGLQDLDALVDRVRSTGLDVLLQVSGDPFEISEAAELTIYRIVQEALTNVLKHAGSPHCVQIRVMYEGSDVSVSVTDDGEAGSGSQSPRSKESGGHGLAGMTERAAAFGGSFSAGPVVGGGWNVSVTLPAGHSSVPA